MESPFTLISHALCPYVQRVAIVLAEKGIAFERVDIDLANKSDWFKKISPLGKTPVLLAHGRPIFESSPICEFLEDTCLPALHPEDPLERAQHRAWMVFGSEMLSTIGSFYNARDDLTLATVAATLKSRFETVETNLGDGRYFSGSRFSVVDAVFGPVFRYFDVFDTIKDFGCFDATPKIRAWRTELAERESVKGAVQTDYPARLRTFLLARNSALSAHMQSLRQN